MSKNREAIYLDELIIKIRENKEIGEIMGNTMIGIAKSCKTIQKEVMPHYNQIRRKEVMAKLAEGKEVYCVAIKGNQWHGLYRLRVESIEDVSAMIADINTAFYEEVE